MTKTAIIALFVLLALACHEAEADRSQQADAAYNRLPDYVSLPRFNHYTFFDVFYRFW
jgi:hypothetical protein